MKAWLIMCVLLFTLFDDIQTSRVLELSDKFIDLSTEGMWFVKFYAPWCAHCRKMEPVWANVAQSLYSTTIRVAKVDCTRFPAVGSHFQIRGYPTIMFIKGSSQHIYSGERERDDLVEFAVRMSQPAIQKLTKAENIGYLKETHPIFFGYIGKDHGALWDVYSVHAEKYQPHSWFYSMSHELIWDDIKVPNENGVFVYREDEIVFFEAKPEVLDEKETLNITLEKWINAERFGYFPKITRSNIGHLLSTDKYIVMTVLSENKLGEITQTEKDFKDMMEELIKKRKKELHARFQFGWTGALDLANSIAMTELTVPNLLVINSTTNHHHLPDDDPVLMTPEAIAMFLDQIHNQMAPTYGGNTWAVRLYRTFFEMRTTLASMWQGNPVLTVLVFGLPLGFLSLICYSVCCADILDADEEEPEDTHEKKD